MATFKVGQRVRVIKHYVGLVPFDVAHLGKEGVVINVSPHLPYPYWVALDSGIVHYFAAEELTPLTDPKADEFIARLKKLGSEPAILTPAQLEEVRGA